MPSPVAGQAGEVRGAPRLAFDPADDRARRIEAATDRARATFGPEAARSATLSDAV
jgi:DNA polymerase IV